MLSAEELHEHIRGCALNKRESQKKIYSSFYTYAMTICNRYAGSEEDAVEILNDSFLKVFKEIDHFTPAYQDLNNSFKGWLRKILIYTSIDHYRKNLKHKLKSELNDNVISLSSFTPGAIEKISHEEIILAIQTLSPAYRTVINLFIIEGYSHEEIASMLHISVGTSKSNLWKARQQLQKIICKQNEVLIKKNVV